MVDALHGVGGETGAMAIEVGIRDRGIPHAMERGRIELTAIWHALADLAEGVWRQQQGQPLEPEDIGRRAARLTHSLIQAGPAARAFADEADVCVRIAMEGLRFDMAAVWKALADLARTAALRQS